MKAFGGGMVEAGSCGVVSTSGPPMYGGSIVEVVVGRRGGGTELPPVVVYNK